MAVAAALALPALAAEAAAQDADEERVSINGKVLDAYTDRPIEGVVVEILETGFRLTTDAQGRFDLLNMAVGTYRLELSHPRYHSAGGSFRIMRPGEFTTRLEPLELEGEGLVTGISGVVTDGPGGSPVSGASIFVDDPSARSSARTDARGRFILDDLSPGPAQVEFAQIGYATRTETIDVVPGRVTNVRVALSPDPVELAPIEIAVERREIALQGVGFYDRREEGFAEFIDREAIEAMGPAETTDIFTRLPGVEMYADPDSPMDRYIVLRGGRQSSFMSGPYGRCFPRVYLDGLVVAQGGDDPAALDRFIDPSALAGAEVFPTSAGVPAQYGGTGASCGVVLLWTRR